MAPHQPSMGAAVSGLPPYVDVDLATLPFDRLTAPQVLADLPPSQCVPFARDASGVEIHGDAVTWWRQAEGRYPRSRLPAAGSVLVMRGYVDPGRGHVAVVSEVVTSRLVRVNQANWMSQGEVTLSVPVIDVSPANDWSQVRVWWIPDRRWGGRTYQAEGFIHPFPFAVSQPVS